MGEEGSFWIVGARRIGQMRVKLVGGGVALFSVTEACDAMEGELDLEPEDLASNPAFPTGSLGDLGEAVSPPRALVSSS